MRTLRIPLPLLEQNYTTYLGADYSTGISVTVLNNNSFAANDLLVFGEPKAELTELKKLNSISGSTGLTLASALNFSHEKGTVIYKTLWDYASIEGRSTSGGVFAELSQSGLQWDNKDGETVYFHSAGDDNWEYRFRFYNSVIGQYSEYSPTLTGAGFSRSQVGYLIASVRKITNIYNQEIVSDDEIIRQFNRAQDIVYAHNPRYWFLLVDSYKQSDPIACVADTSVYSLANYSNFGHLDSVRFRYTSGGNDEIYHLTKKSDKEFDMIASDLNASTNNYADVYKLLPADGFSSAGYIQIYPATKQNSVNNLYPKYYEKMADLDDVGDSTQIPMPEILEDYAIAYVFRVTGNDAKASAYESGLISDNEDKVPRHLLLLDKLDFAQKNAVGQPKNLVQFKGQRGAARQFGNRGYISYLNRDAIKESGIYDE